jgi:hypothetical protein
MAATKFPVTALWFNETPPIISIHVPDPFPTKLFRATSKSRTALPVTSVPAGARLYPSSTCNPVADARYFDTTALYYRSEFGGQAGKLEGRKRILEDGGGPQGQISHLAKMRVALLLVLGIFRYLTYRTRWSDELLGAYEMPGSRDQRGSEDPR